MDETMSDRLRDMCDECLSVSRPSSAVSVAGGKGIKAFYVCAWCQNKWTCGWDSDYAKGVGYYS